MTHSDCEIIISTQYQVVGRARATSVKSEKPISSPPVMEADTVVGKTVYPVGSKRFALERLPNGSLRDDILSQSDEVDTVDFLASLRVWLRLARDIRSKRWEDR